jgi:hypothetical protein
VPKDGGEQSRSSRWHAPQLRFLLFRHAHNGGQVKPVPFRGNQGLIILACWPQGQGCHLRANEVAGRFRDERVQARFILLAHQCRPDLAQRYQALRRRFIALSGISSLSALFQYVHNTVSLPQVLVSPSHKR